MADDEDTVVDFDDIIYLGEGVSFGQAFEFADAISRLGRNSKIWIGNIPWINTVTLRLHDPDAGDISFSGFKVEIMISGSNGYTRLAESGSKNTAGLSDAESIEDIKAGWSKYFDVQVGEKTDGAEYFSKPFRPIDPWKKR